MFREDRTHFRHTEIEVVPFLENFPERERNGTRLDAGRGYLVDKWGKLVVIVAVDQDHLKARLAELVAKAETAETAADNDDALFVALG